jgi:hypothetical protein
VNDGRPPLLAAHIKRKTPPETPKSYHRFPPAAKPLFVSDGPNNYAARSFSPVTYIGRKKPTSRPHCNTKFSQRLRRLRFEGDQTPSSQRLGPSS